MIRLVFNLILLLPLATQGQNISLSIEAGGFGFRQYGSGQIQRYKLDVLLPVDPTGFSVGMNARLYNRSHFFGQLGLRLSNQNIGIKFTDLYPNLPTPNEKVFGVGLGLRQLELPVTVGFRFGDEKKIHIDLISGITPSLNYYSSKDKNTIYTYKKAIYESLNRYSLSYLAGVTIRINRWGLTTTWEKSITSLNHSIIYQNQPYSFNSWYEGVRGLISYQLIK